MGLYQTRALDATEYKEVIKTIRRGYIGVDNVDHRPNNQVADILVLEANLGCRIGDIVHLKHSDVIYDGGRYRLNFTEQKTGKVRTFIVPKPVKEFMDGCGYGKDDRLFKISEAAVWKALRNVTAYLGLVNVSSHSLRKFASHQLFEKSGHDIELVREWLQHSSVKTTQIYLKRSDAKLEKAITENVNIV